MIARIVEKHFSEIVKEKDVYAYVLIKIKQLAIHNAPYLPHIFDILVLVLSENNDRMDGLGYIR